MTILSSLALAEAAQGNSEPLFGNQLYALAAVLIGVAALLFSIAYVGRWLASTRPTNKNEPAPKVPATPVSEAAPVAPAPVVQSVQESGPTIEVFAVIAAAVAATFGSRAQIAGISSVPVNPNDLSTSNRLQWSMEGRRQIYSSHKVR